MSFCNGEYKSYYDMEICAKRNDVSSKSLHYFSFPEATETYCEISHSVMNENRQAFDKKSVATVYGVYQAFTLGLSVLLTSAVAQVGIMWWPPIAQSNSVFRRYLFEFLLISLPTILTVSLETTLVAVFVLLMSLTAVALIWHSEYWWKVKMRNYTLGKRPRVFTFVRANSYLFTVVYILAVDFGFFPSELRKNIKFGAGFMDAGIGSFVVLMGIVSPVPRTARHIKRSLITVLVLLILGLTRTILIMLVSYHQDEHEYGVHLNAFFTLGLTKLWSTFLCGVASTDEQLLLLGLGLLVLHESLLQLGVSNYVMDDSVMRNNLFDANREGLCSLLGFAALYIISIYISKWMQKDTTLSFKAFFRKLTILALLSTFLWVVLFLSIFTIGISRVTCNFGYVVWVLSYIVSMFTGYLFFYDLILNTIKLGEEKASYSEASGDESDRILKSTSLSDEPGIPLVLESINNNGLVFFVIGNLLTGSVNIFLSPEKRTDIEGFLILLAYTVISTGVVYILSIYKIRIA